MKKLIFIEGVSGVGKSTTTANLYDELKNIGYKASCHLEGDADNPIDLCWFAYLTKPEFERLLITHPHLADIFLRKSITGNDYYLVQYRDRQTRFYPQEIHEYLEKREACYKPANPIPLKEYTMVFRDRWRRFSDSAFIDYEYVIFDGAFLHHPINDLLRNYRASDVEIAQHLELMSQMVLPLAPVIFYLSSENVKERLEKASQSRGQNIPTTEQIGFWENRKRIDLMMLRTLPVESHVINISQDNWDCVIGYIRSNVAKTWRWWCKNKIKPAGS